MPEGAPARLADPRRRVLISSLGATGGSSTVPAEDHRSQDCGTMHVMRTVIGRRVTEVDVG